MIGVYFNETDHKRLWRYLKDHPWLDIDSGIKKACENEIINLEVGKKYLQEDLNSCRTGCRYARLMMEWNVENNSNNKCKYCPFKIINSKKCLGGIVKIFIKGSKKLRKYRKLLKRIKLRKNTKIKKYYNHICIQQKYLANKILNWKIKDGTPCI